jgi:hypothetical protein
MLGRKRRFSSDGQGNVITGQQLITTLEWMVLDRIPQTKHFSGFYSSHGMFYEKFNVRVDERKRANAHKDRHRTEEYACTPADWYTSFSDSQVPDLVQNPLDYIISIILCMHSYDLLYDISDWITTLGKVHTNESRAFIQNRAKLLAEEKGLPITQRQQWALLTHNLSEYYIKSIYTWSLGWTRIDRATIKLIAGSVGYRDVEDWGCGRGLISLLLAHELHKHKHKRGQRVYAIDTFEERRPLLLEGNNLPNLYVRWIRRPPRQHELEQKTNMTNVATKENKLERDARLREWRSDNLKWWQMGSLSESEQAYYGIDTKQTHIAFDGPYELPNPRRALLISWGRDVEYAVDYYVRTGGRCLVVIGEHATNRDDGGCTYWPNEDELVRKHKFKLRLQDTPTFCCIRSRIAIFTR